MPDIKEPHWQFNGKQIVIGVLAIISMTLGTWKAISDKADQKDVDNLALKVTDKAEKKAVDDLQLALYELAAKRREDFIILKNIQNIADNTDKRIGKIEDGQQWQIQQEVKRLQWQSFKGEPPAAPAPNVNK